MRVMGRRFSNLEKLATGSCMAKYPGWEWLDGKIPEEAAGTNMLLENIVYVGLRDVDMEEQKMIDGEYEPMPISKMKQFSAKDVVKLGIEVSLRTSQHAESHHAPSSIAVRSPSGRVCCWHRACVCACVCVCVREREGGH